jgi:hypothetical protein
MNELHDSDLNPPLPQSTIDLRDRAVALRRGGLTYEEIAEQLSDATTGLTPWWIYATVNPDKTPAQIAAWMKKHHPDQDAWVLKSLAKHNPAALRRMEQEAQREFEYIRAKGLE